MEINLPPQVEEMLNRKIASGMYHSATDAIAMALLVLDDYEEWEKENFPPQYVKEKIREALEESGPSVSGPEFFAKWRAELAAKTGSRG